MRAGDTRPATWSTTHSRPIRLVAVQLEAGGTAEPVGVVLEREASVINVLVLSPADKDPVADPGMAGVDAPHPRLRGQAVTPPGSRQARSSTRSPDPERLPQPLAAATARRKLRSILHRHHVLSPVHGFHVPDRLRIDDRRPINADEESRVQLHLHLREGSCTSKARTACWSKAVTWKPCLHAGHSLSSSAPRAVVYGAAVSRWAPALGGSRT